jgi:hypothetical protein
MAWIFNPTMSEHDLIGEWRTDSLAVVFLPDHAFTLTGNVHAHGRWDVNIDESFGATAFSPGGLLVGRERWHAVRKRGELRLVRNTPQDWDEWNGDLGFRRIDAH